MVNEQIFWGRQAKVQRFSSHSIELMQSWFWCKSVMCFLRWHESIQLPKYCQNRQSHDTNADERLHVSHSLRCRANELFLSLSPFHRRVRVGSLLLQQFDTLCTLFVHLSPWLKRMCLVNDSSFQRHTHFTHKPTLEERRSSSQKLLCPVFTASEPREQCLGLKWTLFSWPLHLTDTLEIDSVMHVLSEVESIMFYQHNRREEEQVHHKRVCGLSCLGKKKILCFIVRSMDHWSPFLVKYLRVLSEDHFQFFYPCSSCGLFVFTNASVLKRYPDLLSFDRKSVLSSLAENEEEKMLQTRRYTRWTHTQHALYSRDKKKNLWNREEKQEVSKRRDIL